MLIWSIIQAEQKLKEATMVQLTSAAALERKKVSLGLQVFAALSNDILLEITVHFIHEAAASPWLKSFYCLLISQGHNTWLDSWQCLVGSFLSSDSSLPSRTCYLQCPSFVQSWWLPRVEKPHLLIDSLFKHILTVAVMPPFMLGAHCGQASQRYHAVRKSHPGQEEQGSNLSP